MANLNNVLLDANIINKSLKIERVDSNKYIVDLFARKITYKRYCSGFEVHFDINVDGIAWYYNNKVDEEFKAAFICIQDRFHSLEFENKDEAEADLKNWIKELEKNQ